MDRVEKTVFISYRRKDLPWAKTIYDDLTHNGYDVFYDLEGLGSGGFEQAIFDHIQARAHFLVLLTPSALDRCTDPRDMFRREIECALFYQRNIVPVMIDGFSFGAPGLDDQQWVSLGALKSYNGVQVHEQISEALVRIRRFINVPLTSVAHPPRAQGGFIPADHSLVLTTRFSPMAMLPLSVPPNSIAYLLPISPEPNSFGLMEISNNSSTDDRVWPDVDKAHPSPPQMCHRYSVFNTLDKTVVNIRLFFKVDFRIPRPGGGIVATDPIDSTSFRQVVIPLIRPQGHFEFVVANRSTTHAAQLALSTDSVIQIAGEVGPRKIALVMSEASLLDMLGSMALFPALVKW